MSLALVVAAGDPGNWLEAVFIVVFLLGGAVKSIFNARRERAQASAPRPRPDETAPRELEEDQRDGLERWRELLEGRVEPAPPPRRVPVPAPELPDEVERGYEALAELERAHRASPFAYTPSEEDLEARRDEAAPVEILPTLAVAELALGHGEVTHALRRARMRSWRNALAGAEILARPLALRRADELPGAIPR